MGLTERIHSQRRSWGRLYRRPAILRRHMPATYECFGRGQQSASTLGADGARTMMLVYNLPHPDAIY
jgi:hypothetical protein